MRTLFGPLLEPTTVEEATRAFVEETNRLNREWHTSFDATYKSLKETENGIKDILDSMQRGGFSRSLNNRLRELEVMRDALTERLSVVPSMEIPILSTTLFRAKVERLAETLNRAEERIMAVDELAEIIRCIEIKPDLSQPARGRTLPVLLHVNLAGLLGVPTDDERIAVLPPFVIPA